jgi:hypothetical protein
VLGATFPELHPNGRSLLGQEVPAAVKSKFSVFGTCAFEVCIANRTSVPAITILITEVNFEIIILLV